MTDIKRDPDREAMVAQGVNNSPYYRHINMKVVEFTDQGSVMTMEIGDTHKNIWGTAHGGAIASLVDSSCGTAAIQALGKDEVIVTFDLRTQYLAPVTENRLVAHGRVVHRTTRHIIAETEVYNEAGELKARGNSIHAIVASD